MSNDRKTEHNAPSSKPEKPLRDLPSTPDSDSADRVRGGKTPSAPSPIPMPYPN